MNTPTNPEESETPHAAALFQAMKPEHKKKITDRRNEKTMTDRFCDDPDCLNPLVRGNADALIEHKSDRCHGPKIRGFKEKIRELEKENQQLRSEKFKDLEDKQGDEVSTDAEKDIWQMLKDAENRVEYLGTLPLSDVINDIDCLIMGSDKYRRHPELSAQDLYISLVNHFAQTKEENKTLTCQNKILKTGLEKIKKKHTTLSILNGQVYMEETAHIVEKLIEDVEKIGD